MLNFNDCLEKRMIRRIPASKEKALQALHKSSELLGEAQGSLKDGRLNSAIMTGYAATFNAAHAILFRDGFTEKSHVCVISYLSEKYSNKIKPEMIHLFDRYRTYRHNVQYDESSFATEDEAKEFLEFADAFIEIAEKLIG